jgi:haloacetate dehalogenase
VDAAVGPGQDHRGRPGAAARAGVPGLTAGDIRVFGGFAEFDLATAEGTVHGRHGGSGPPVLLLHGIPETHLMWHRVAPRLAERFTVVATDLRGFGASTSPPPAADHAPNSMRAIGREQVEVMAALGHDRFAVVGHDRGARCAYRMAIDHPDAVERLAVLDVVPTGESFRRVTRDFALGYWLWAFLAAPAPVPEQLIAGASDALVDHMLDEWSDDPSAFPDELRSAYRAPFRDPATVSAICEEYRAAATLDVEHDERDRGRRPIRCPVLALWSATGPTATWYDPLAVWREWADDVTGAALQCGHFLPEEAPAETVRHLLDFLG